MKVSKLLVLFSSLFIINSACASINNSVKSYQNNINVFEVKKANEEVSNPISNKTELLDFIKNANSDGFSKNKTINLVNDIDLEGEIIKPIPIFAGILNGNNHEIKNFTIDSNSAGNESGFIRVLTSDGEVNDLTISSNMDVKNDETHVGGIIGTNNGLVNNCVYNGTIKARHIVGGIVGENESTGIISNCVNKGQISGKVFAAGIVGFNKGEITTCENKGIINSLRFSSSDELTLSNIGGICGFNQNKIDDCTNHGIVGRKQVGALIGGISGSSVGVITNCFNYGEVRGDINVGGIVGHYAEFANDQKDDNLDDILSLINKIIGNNTKAQQNAKIGTSNPSSLKYCYNNGFINGNTSVGGIAGYLSSPSLNIKVFDINSCINEGAVEANKESLGGLVGNQLSGKIYECFNIGNIHGKNATNVGGIVGKSGGEVAYCFAINDMIGKMYVGGIGGINHKLHDCYSICKIDCKNSFVGALSGQISEIDGNVSNNYYVNDDFYGIDNIDYENKSIKINKDELASIETLSIDLDPEFFIADSLTKSYPQLKSFIEVDEMVVNKDFFTLKMREASKFASFVNFIDENGDIIKKIAVGYGEDLDLNEVPLVPQKEGYFAKWSDFDHKNITKNLYIKPIYNQIITTIASEKGAKPSVLVQGEFYESTYVIANISNEDILDNKSIYSYINTYHIEVKDDINTVNQTNIKIKIALPKKYEHIRVAILNKDKLEILESKVDGNYVVFDANEGNTYYLLDQKFANWNNGAFIATVVSSIVGGLLIIGGITFGVIHHKKKIKTKKDNKSSK